MAEKTDAPRPKDLATTLSEQATQLRTAQRIARLGAYTLDLVSGTWTSCDMLDEIFGLERTRFAYTVEGWLSLVHPEDRARMQAYFQERVVGAGERFDREYRIIRPCDGTERWVHGCGELTFDAQGRAVQMIGTIQDCTARHQAEEALRSAHLRLREMFDGARDAVLLADVETGRIIDANRAASELLHRPRAELIGMHQTDLHPPEERTRYRERFAVHSQDITPIFLDTEVFTADGRRVPVEIAASLVPLSDGRTAIQGIFRDVTARKRAEQEVLRREARIASVFRAVPVGIFVVNNRRFLEANPYVEQLIGHAPADLIGRSVRLLYPDDAEYERVGREAYPTIRACGTCCIETTWRHKDGRILNILLSAASIVHEGEQGAITFAAVDMTDRRRLEAQLRQAQKMEAIGQLAGGVAHDFNNILTAILLHAGHLRQDAGLGTERLEAIDDILRGAKRAADLTRQLLVFSRQQVMRKQPVNLDHVIAGLLRMLQRVLGENIEIVFQQSEEPTSVEGDPGMLEQVLMNLCINARDAMPAGGRLTLATRLVSLESTAVPAHAAARAGLFVRLTVTDSGIGIPPANLSRIFDPFFTTKEVGQGTGLGLATVLGIVEQHQGWIDVESVVGTGTSFTIHLPASLASAPVPVEKPSPAAPARAGTGTLLLVEDDGAVRKPIADLLRRQGYGVLEAADGDEGLALWRADPGRIALIVADFMMPGQLSGVQLAQKLTEERPELPVIILSGYSPGLVTRAAPGPAARFVHLTKPCDGAVLLRTIGDLIAPPPAPQEA